VTLLPGDRWLKLYVEVYRACLLVAVDGAEPEAERTDDAAAAATDVAIARALASSRASEFRMETLVLVYQARFALARHDVAAARATAEAALVRATDPLRANPFDEILARRALADVLPGADGIAELTRALALATHTHNVLQEGIVRLTLADRLWDVDRAQAIAQLDAADARFTAARADRWLRRAHDRRARGA
jgi:hypothetical protein